MNIILFGSAGWLGRAVLSKSINRAKIRSFDHSPDAWNQFSDIDGDWTDGEMIYGDISDFHTVDRAMSGMDAVIHSAVYYPSENVEDDQLPFIINLKGLWNVLESARRNKIETVVHVGSCLAVHPKGLFFDANTRSIEGDVYGICKRLQEEMCRQFHDAFGMKIIVLRPDYIVDSHLGIERYRKKLGTDQCPWQQGWVCRHDLAEACLLAAENRQIEFEVLHIVGTSGAEKYCNVERAKDLLGLKFHGKLDQYRHPR